MAYIRSIAFNGQTPNALKRVPYGSDWPVVYVINNDKEAYIGETVDAVSRMTQHLMNADRQRLSTLSIISDDTFNKSVILDLESFLIKHMFADGRYQLQNGNAGLHLHNYFNRTIYEKRFRDIWAQLQRTTTLAANDIDDIENSDLFKYSPFTALSTDQFTAVANIISGISKAIDNGKQNTTVIQGGPGTGKTILAVYLMKLLSQRDLGTIDTLAAEDDSVDSIVENLRLLPSAMKAAFVVPMQSLRTTLKNVFASVRGLNPNMIIAPIDVPKSRYDLLIVDEAHRLRKRKGLSQYPAFDANNKLLGLGNEGTELDWIMKCSKHQVFFYDGQQSVRPADVDKADFEKLLGKASTTTLKLGTQFRCKGGDEYIKYIGDILSSDPPEKFRPFDGYDLLLFEDVGQMVDAIRENDRKYGLCRTVAGYAWKWVSKDDPSEYDIHIQGHHYRWNSTNVDWVNSPNALDEIGCIHTIQGYDLNYAGIILGPEIDYIRSRHCLEVDKNKYCDTIGKATIANDPDLLLEYICNIYRTMMTRGIRGTYVYACNKGLRDYLAQYMEIVRSSSLNSAPSETSDASTVAAPAPAGNVSAADQNDIISLFGGKDTAYYQDDETTDLFLAAEKGAEYGKKKD